jgi:hypothetical protein
MTEPISQPYTKECEVIRVPSSPNSIVSGYTFTGGQVPKRRQSTPDEKRGGLNERRKCPDNQHETKGDPRAGGSWGNLFVFSVFLLRDSDLQHVVAQQIPNLIFYLWHCVDQCSGDRQSYSYRRLHAPWQEARGQVIDLFGGL